jgi:hypothetical protein
MARPVAVGSEMVELLDSDRALKAFKAHAKRPEVGKLKEHVTKRGYVLLDKPEDAFSIKSTVKATGAVRPPAGTSGKQIQTVEFELLGMSTIKDKKDHGAVASSIIRAGDNELVYDFVLEAPGMDFRKAKEFALHDGKVVDANSWWSAWVGCLRGRCASTCLTSLGACSGTWAAYFWCVAAACGGCVLRCAACAGCDCSWWCRWASGCCDR